MSVLDALDDRERGLAYADDRDVEEWRDRHPEVAEVIDALRAVAKIHTPGEYAHCVGCGTDSLGINPIDYPCATVSAMAAELGETS